MSQYGAYGFAKHGKEHEEILSHYFRGTELSDARGRSVRVLLQRNREPGAAFDGAESIDDRKLKPGKTYLVRLTKDGEIAVREQGGKLVDRFSGPVLVTPADESVRLFGPAINDVTDGNYRGQIELSSEKSGITAINDVALEKYLWGVIPTEMPSSWHPEALKAQAVAARSYAHTDLIDGEAFDLYPDQRSQVYGGVQAEDPRTTEAAQATSGRVLRYEDEIATTYFSSASGGRTENVENSLGGEPTPYLRSVRDPHDDLSPLHRWKRKFSAREIEHKLDGLFSGDFLGVTVLERGESPRVVSARVEGSEGSTIASGATLRARLSLPDTWAFFDADGGASALETSAKAASPDDRITPLEEKLPIAPPLPFQP